jgi:hypothetical protein
VVAAHEEIHAIVSDEIYDAMLLGYAPRPDISTHVLQRLGFSNSGERITHDGFDQVQNAQGSSAISLHPMTQIPAEFILENRFSPGSLSRAQVLI